MADTGADVTIRYSFLPTESSIREGVERVTKQIDRVGGKSLGVSSAKKLKTESDKTVDFIINILRATQQKTSLQTKIMAGLKVGKSLFGGEGEEGAGGGGIGGALTGGGGMMAILGTIAALLVAISVAMFIMSAFFEAVGPIIKMLTKVLAAFFLLLLAPIIKKLAPSLSAIIKGFVHFGEFMATVEEFLLNATPEQIGMAAITWSPLEILSQLNAFLTGLIQGILLGWTNFWSSLFGNLLSWWINLWNKFYAWIWNGILGGLQVLKDFGKTLLTSALNKIFVGLSVLIPLGQTLLDNIISAVSSGLSVLNNLGQWLWDSVASAVFGGKSNQTTNKSSVSSTAVKNASSLVGNMFSTANSIIDSLLNPKHGDFISRPGMGIQSFSPNDTIIGTKGGMGGGQTINNYLTVSAGVDKNEFRKILSDFNREQARELRMRTSYVSGVYA